MSRKDFEYDVPNATGAPHRLTVTHPGGSTPAFVTLQLSPRESPDALLLLKEYEKLAAMLNRKADTTQHGEISIHTGDQFDPALGVILVGGLESHGMAQTGEKEKVLRRLVEEGHVPGHGHERPRAPSPTSTR